MADAKSAPPLAAGGNSVETGDEFFESLYSSPDGQSAYAQAQAASHIGRVTTTAGSTASAPAAAGATSAAAAAAALSESVSFFYGEFRYAAIQQIIAILKPAGSGRSLFTFAVCCPQLKICHGIELVRPLHDLAERAYAELQKRCSSGSSAATDAKPAAAAPTATPPAAAPVKLSCGDFLIHDWWSGVGGADIVIACSTAFDDSLMSKIADRCRHLRVGARVVTVSNPLPNQNVNRMFELVWSGKVTMSWTDASAATTTTTAAPAADAKSTDPAATKPVSAGAGAGAAPFGSATVYIYEKKHNRTIENVILKSFLRKK